MTTYMPFSIYRPYAYARISILNLKKQLFSLNEQLTDNILQSKCEKILCTVEVGCGAGGNDGCGGKGRSGV